MDTSYQKLIENWPNELKMIASENRFAYIHEKARLFLLLGAEKYRKMDFFKQPNDSLTEEEIEILKVGCEQLLNGKGLTAENPLENLDVSGFNSLMRLFHFNPIQRKSKSANINQTRGIIDQITFEHLIEDSQVTYYNYCTYDFGDI